MKSSIRPFNTTKYSQDDGPTIYLNGSGKSEGSSGRFVGKYESRKERVPSRSDSEKMSVLNQKTSETRDNTGISNERKTLFLKS